MKENAVIKRVSDWSISTSVEKSNMHHLTTQSTISSETLVYLAFTYLKLHTRYRTAFTILHLNSTYSNNSRWQVNSYLRYSFCQYSVTVGGDKAEQTLQKRVNVCLAAWHDLVCKHRKIKHFVFVGRAYYALVISKCSFAINQPWGKYTQIIRVKDEQHIYSRASH